MGQRQTLLKTPKVVEWGRKHFGCDTLAGVELEDDGGKFTAGSHWEKRHVMNEFMAGAPSGFANAKSIFTLALLEDSGWYRANYSHADPLRWGYMYGCSFLNSCDPKTPDPPEGFCKKQTGLQCAFDRSAVGKCHSEGTYIAGWALLLLFFTCLTFSHAPLLQGCTWNPARSSTPLCKATCAIIGTGLPPRLTRIVKACHARVSRFLTRVRALNPA